MAFDARSGCRTPDLDYVTGPFWQIGTIGEGVGLSLTSEGFVGTTVRCIASLAIGLLLLPGLAAAQNPYASIALGKNGTQFGYSTNPDSLNSAERAALAQCARYARDCEIFKSIENGCVALAIARNAAAGWSTVDSPLCVEPTPWMNAGGREAMSVTSSPTSAPTTGDSRRVGRNKASAALRRSARAACGRGRSVQCALAFCTLRCPAREPLHLDVGLAPAHSGEVVGSLHAKPGIGRAAHTHF